MSPTEFSEYQHSHSISINDFIKWKEFLLHAIILAKLPSYEHMETLSTSNK